MNTNPKNQNFFEVDEEFTSMKKSPQWSEYEYWLQKKNRILVVNDEVADYLIDDVMIPIMQWNEEDSNNNLEPEDRLPIKLYINTDGGDVDVCMGIVSAINASKTPVHTYALAKAYSCGAILLMAGHKRLAYEFSSILIHEGSTGIMNSASKTRDFIEYQSRVNEKIKEMIVARTNISSELYDKKFRDEWFIMGYEAAQLGIIDEIIQ